LLLYGGDAIEGGTVELQLTEWDGGDGGFAVMNLWLKRWVDGMV
jgi:hypothetical protein